MMMLKPVACCVCAAAAVAAFSLCSSSVFGADASAPMPVLEPLPVLESPPVPVVDPDLPQPLDPGFAEGLLMQSPFTRSVNLEQTLQLTGVAYLNGRPVATVLNKQTKQSFLVTDVQNQVGWRLLAVDAGTDPGNTQIEMMVGPETIRMHYHSQEMSSGSAGKGGSTRLAGSKKGAAGDSKFRASTLLGDRGKELYASLSPQGRDKFKEMVRDRMEKHPEFTPEQNSAYAQKVFAKLKATDAPAASSSKTKPPKKKQGA